MTQVKDLLQSLDELSGPQLRRLLAEHLTRQQLGLFWEASAKFRRGIATPVCK